MSKNFKTPAAAAFITGITQTEPGMPLQTSAPAQQVSTRTPSTDPADGKASETSKSKKPTRESTHQINGKQVVVIYRRPRKGDKVERRTRQAHLLMLPSLYKEAQRYAKTTGISFNALVEDALLAYLEQHKES